MPKFVKVGESYINLDQVITVQDQGGGYMAEGEYEGDEGFWVPRSIRLVTTGMGHGSCGSEDYGTLTFFPAPHHVYLEGNEAHDFLHHLAFIASPSMYTPQAVQGEK